MIPAKICLIRIEEYPFLYFILWTLCDTLFLHDHKNCFPVIDSQLKLHLWGIISSSNTFYYELQTVSLIEKKVVIIRKCIQSFLYFIGEKDLRCGITALVFAYDIIHITYYCHILLLLFLINTVLMQWAVLTRKHAKVVVHDETVFPVFQQHCRVSHTNEYSSSDFLSSWRLHFLKKAVSKISSKLIMTLGNCKQDKILLPVNVEVLES